MAGRRQLKVFRTPIGFHDAYVAAPSQKAALEAWGADSNLFAVGAAELVDDPELMREPLAAPGKVVRRLRGTLADHVAALPRKAAPPKPGEPTRKESPPGAASKPSRPKPRPKRTALDKVEAKLSALEDQQADESADLARRQAALEKERQTIEARQQRERDRLAARVEAARAKYEQAMQAWRES